MAQPFLRIPPFPGHRAAPLAEAESGRPLDASMTATIVELLRAERVGGAFWAAQPSLPSGRDLLLAPSSSKQGLEMVRQARSEGTHDRCIMLTPRRGLVRQSVAPVPTIAGPVDPWHLARAARQVWAGADHELALVAALSGTDVRLFGQGRFAGCGEGNDGLARAVSANLGSGCLYRSPFTGEPISAVQAVEMLSDWRKLIDSNRCIAAVVGVGSWKRPTVDALLWGGGEPPRHAREIPRPPSSDSCIAAWKSRTPKALLARLNERGLNVAEIEDGMIRGPGLGANCVPPLSIVVDFSGIYFDPSEPSDLERLLETAEFDGRLLDRAARLRERIVGAGISKYENGSNPTKRQIGTRRILAVGQVEDDRSILSGGNGQTNLELLQRARSMEPDAWLIYRPHPDVEAGHRKGHIPDHVALQHANEIHRGGSISSLIDAVDGVHCITSLAGFEALLRLKPVTTHGVPFYAGWGLTRDLGSIPSRHTRRRSLDELVAATLILYPRYLDPASRLPCRPEVLVGRLERGEATVPAPLAGVRKLQGKLMVVLRNLREAA